PAVDLDIREKARLVFRQARLQAGGQGPQQIEGDIAGDGVIGGDHDIEARAATQQRGQHGLVGAELQDLYRDLMTVLEAPEVVGVVVVGPGRYRQLARRRTQPWRTRR